MTELTLTPLGRNKMEEVGIDEEGKEVIIEVEEEKEGTSKVRAIIMAEISITKKDPIQVIREATEVEKDLITITGAISKSTITMDLPKLLLHPILKVILHLTKVISPQTLSQEEDDRKEEVIISIQEGGRMPTDSMPFTINNPSIRCKKIIPNLILYNSFIILVSLSWL